jgi:ATP-binding cassette subfamily B protein/ATP-binding cassette subfamily C protein
MTNNHPPLWKPLWQLIRYTPKLYFFDSCFWILIMSLPGVPGLIIREFFNALTDNARLGFSLWAMIVLLLVVDAGQIAVIFAGRWTKTQHRFTMSSLLQRNLLEHLLNRPGAMPLTVPGNSQNIVSPGEAISYFRDDADRIQDTIASISESLGAGLLAFSALVILWSINARITILVFIPLVIILVIIQKVRTRIRRYRQASRQATEQVTGLIGEMFSAVQAVKIAGAEPMMLNYFNQVSDRRRQLMVNDQLLTAILNATFENLVGLGTGLILLLAAIAIQAEADPLSVGDFALFVYYLPFLTYFLSDLGHFLAILKQTEVSFERMAGLLQPPTEQLTDKERSASHPSTTSILVAHNPLYLPDLLGRKPQLPSVEQPNWNPKNNASSWSNDRLQTLTVSNLTYRYPDAEGGISDIHLTIPQGSLTVITGRVGSGKTTLLRVLLGLLPRQAGEIYWNGQRIDDPANFFLPPRSAYTPQVPKLFSDSLRENILMGLDRTEAEIAQAIALAALEQDIRAMPEGLETLIGSRGVRLSGGQLQRAAAARMFVHQPELLVFDDLSSALDVETEQKLWLRLFPTSPSTHPLIHPSTPTCLVVSHRRMVLERADRILVLRNSQVVAQGTFETLQAICAELQMV